MFPTTYFPHTYFPRVFFPGGSSSTTPIVVKSGGRFYRYQQLWQRVWRYSVNRIPVTVRTKTIEETRDFIADFSNAPELNGNSDLEIDTVEVNGGTGLDFGFPEVNTERMDGVEIGKGVAVRISGGLAGTYDFKVWATLDNGAKLEVPCRLVVV